MDPSTVAMLSAIITAILSSVASISGSMFVQNKKQAVLETKLDALKEDISTLSIRVDKHNTVIERTTRLETKVEALEKKI